MIGRHPHCGGRTMLRGRGRVNTTLLTFFNLDWLNPSAHTLTCAECGHVDWFFAKPTPG